MKNSILRLLVLGGSTAIVIGSLGADAQSAQTSTARATGVRNVAGVVVNERTGQPLPQVTVTLRQLNAPDRPPLGESTTDAQGRFSFASLPDGKFALFAVRPGYQGSMYDEHPGGLSTAIVTGDGLDTSELRIGLHKYGAMYGTVSEDSGDPVPNARIIAFRPDPNGSGKIVRAGETMADPEGNYDLRRLTPGNYFLCVIGNPWYATRSRTTFLRDGTEQEAPRSPLDLVYPMTCHPGVTDTSEAEAIAVPAGERVPLPFSLHAVPSVHMVLPVQRRGENRGFTIPRLSQKLFGTEEYVQTTVGRMIDARGQNGPSSIEISAPPGQYEVQLQGEQNRFTTINATNDGATLDASSTTPVAEVTGKLRMASGERLPANLALSLSTEQEQFRPQSGIDADGSFKLQPAQPGEYRVTCSSPSSDVYIQQLSVNGVPTRKRTITVGSDPVTLNATLARAVATVSGFAARNGVHTAGIFLALVPRDRSDKPIINQSDSDGSFEFPHTAPGDYTLVAVENGWTLDWAHSESFAPYLAKGVRVQVQAGARAVGLQDAIEVQAK